MTTKEGVSLTPNRLCANGFLAPIKLHKVLPFGFDSPRLHQSIPNTNPSFIFVNGLFGIVIMRDHEK